MQKTEDPGDAVRPLHSCAVGGHGANILKPKLLNIVYCNPEWQMKIFQKPKDFKIKLKFWHLL
jgi:hypothetical protein